MKKVSVSLPSPFVRLPSMMIDVTTEDDSQRTTDDVGGLRVANLA